MVSLDWEEGIFRGVYRLWRHCKAAPEPDDAVPLESCLEHILITAQLVAGRPLQIRAAEGVGGIRGSVLLMPAAMGPAPTVGDNHTMYLVRAVLNGAAAAQWEERDTIHGMAGRVRYLFAVSRAYHELCACFAQFAVLHTKALGWELALRHNPQNLSPGAAELEALRLKLASGEKLDEQAELTRFKDTPTPNDLPPGLLLWGETLTAGDLHTAAQAAPEPAQGVSAEDGTEIKAPPKDYVSLTTLEQVDDIPPIPLHTFEKTETLDNYKGGVRQVDGDDELEEHLEALEELDLREVIRGGAQSKGFYQADIDLGEAIPDMHHVLPNEVGVAYPEWLYKSQTYRENWVTVYPTRVRSVEAQKADKIIAAQRGRILRLRDQLLAHRTKNVRCTRQTQGEDLDLDAVVNAHADRCAGRDPGEKLYITQRKQQRDTAITLLFDISLSCGSWIAGRRVLDITRETVLILGEVAHSLGDQFRIMAFASNTRNHCRVFDVKDWADSWTQARHRVCGVEPQGYTRIGPALRHAVKDFEGVDAKRRGLLVITDGKPTDYDRYEGAYGREDIRMAVREAHESGIHTHALALDPRARRTLPVMFGAAGWEVLIRPDDLCEAVVTAYGRFHRS